MSSNESEVLLSPKQRIPNKIAPIVPKNLHHLPESVGVRQLMDFHFIARGLATIC
jgi:hypothetical protein